MTININEGNKGSNQENYPESYYTKAIEHSYCLHSFFKQTPLTKIIPGVQTSWDFRLNYWRATALADAISVQASISKIKKEYHDSYSFLSQTIVNNRKDTYVNKCLEAWLSEDKPKNEDETLYYGLILDPDYKVPLTLYAQTICGYGPIYMPESAVYSNFQIACATKIQNKILQLPETLLIKINVEAKEAADSAFRTPVLKFTADSQRNKGFNGSSYF